MISNFTLLYVEDEIIVRESFSEIFKTYFKEVLTAKDGEEGFELYKNNHIDVAILDISIPKIDGLTLAKKIRDENQDIEIIMLTGHSERDKLLKAINLHLFSYLVKPVKKEPLDASLQRLIKKLTNKKNINLKRNYSFNLNTQVLYYYKNSIKLSKNELKLVSFLVEHFNEYVSAYDISSIIFDTVCASDASCNNLIQLISRFKKKMLDLHKTEHFFIENIYGLGYTIQKV